MRHRLKMSEGHFAAALGIVKMRQNIEISITASRRRYSDLIEDEKRRVIVGRRELPEQWNKYPH